VEGGCFLGVLSGGCKGFCRWVLVLKGSEMLASIKFVVGYR
jgi:hypothetical protein